MKKNAIYLFFVLVSWAMFSFSANSQTITVNGSIEKSFVKRGTIAKGSITLLIPKELHVNSNKPTSEFMIPTKLRLSSNQIKITQIIYPKGKDRKFDFSEEKINVYEGKTTIGFRFNVPKNLRATVIKIFATINYQACTNEVCYQPTKKQIFLTAKVL